MTNKAGNKGTWAETALVNYLQVNGWPHCERRRLKGNKDQGDISGIPDVCIEVKWANAGIRMSSWFNQMSEERNHAGASLGVLVIKPLGVGDKRVGRWYAVMMTGDQDRLIAAAAGVKVNLGEPFTYNATVMMDKLTEATERQSRRRQGEVNILQAVPPNMKDFPYVWYRITYLEDLVKLLHSAGYGVL